MEWTIPPQLQAQVDDRRKNWIPDKPGVPPTRPAAPPTGQAITLPLPGRTLKAYLHRPATQKQRYPVYFNFHGGGMCAGSAEIDEFLCDGVCHQAECAVVNVDYRLAPEHPFPQGVCDAFESVQYVLAHAGQFGVLPDKAALGGQSAGACLAAACAIRNGRENAFTYQGIALLYAGLNFAPRTDDREVPGVVNKKSGELYSQCYSMGGGDMHDPLASPVLASPADVQSIPSALFLPAELDNLRLDSEDFARLLIQAGVPVVYRQFPQCAHGFTHRAYPKEPDQAIALLARYLRGLWN